MTVKNKNKILDLIRAICMRVKEREGYLNKTKLIKYLYLIDVEFYRVNNETFTGFNWIFKDYGPWAYEYNEIFEDMKANKYDFNITEGDRRDLDTVFISVTRDGEIELDRVIKEFILERRAGRIIDKWAGENLAHLLNYVYFDTEPMVDAERFKPLDFSKIHSLESIPKFKLSKGCIDAKQLSKLRKELRIRLKEQSSKATAAPTFTPPRYDDVYWEGISKLEEEDSY